jgi:hypothetical protein
VWKVQADRLMNRTLGTLHDQGLPFVNLLCFPQMAGIIRKKHTVSRT